MRRKSLVVALLMILCTVSPGAGQSRVDFHLLPAVSTTPLDPAWSPDGQWIAFSMRGDVWKVPAAGGDAVALTEGPAYHFEPAWSPDGSRLALTVETDGNLDIGIVDAGGGPVERLTEHTAEDVEPTWGPDGTIYFVSQRQRGLSIWHLDPGTGAPPEAVATGPGNAFQPAVSPDGTMLAYVGSVRGRLGSGGIWVLPLATAGTGAATAPGQAASDAAAARPSPVGGTLAGQVPGSEPRLVHYEETSYRVRPSWSPDGTTITYASDVAGSSDLAVVPAAGGNPVHLTEGPDDEFAPAVSPDGSRIAFVSNLGGPTTLYTMPAVGGARSSWRRVELRERRPRQPHGMLRGTVAGPGGVPTPARIILTASDGRAYTEDGAFHRKAYATGTHYAHSDGTFEIEVPAGPVQVEAMRGFEYAPVRETVEVPAGGAADVALRLERLVDLPARSWYSGDTHVHELHEGRRGLTHEEYFLQLVADDLHVTNDLIHMDGTKLMGRWDDLTGEPHPLSTGEHILFYTQEFRGSYGHVALLGAQRFIMPLIGGTGSSPYAADVLKVRHLDAIREMGGLGGFVHPYNGPVDTPERAASADIPLHVALGRGDFFDVISVASLEEESSAIYHRLLNCGFRLAATGGTDNFSDVWLDPSGGTARTYARVEGPLTYGTWLEAVRERRTFASSGPLLFLEVDGREPGAEIRLDGGDPASLEVSLELVSFAAVDRVELLVNGAVARSWTPPATEPRRTPWRVTAHVELPEGGWIAARARGPQDHRVGDAFPYAHTSPVWVVRDGTTWTSAEDALFLQQTVQALWERVDRRDSFATDADRETYRSAVEEAMAVFQRIIDAGRNRR